MRERMAVLLAGAAVLMVATLGGTAMAAGKSKAVARTDRKGEER